ncbi:MAM and LDL-receptor class A domain-containing protein 1-like isoform X2 [Ornithodoros turicata]|uniref:MAM and LDL-receptor class A domain-containing protein 1-like isoform X2 n=1 Tax=Ornithodoros turicata TaxID=34597 RepID=UPI003139FAFC
MERPRRHRLDNVVQRACCALFFLTCAGLVTQAFADSPSCDFEKGHSCEWSLGDCTKSSCFNVTRPKDVDYGPTTDHSSNSEDGWYAMAVYNGSEEARLERDVTGPFCLRVWYQLSGYDDPRMEIVVSGGQSGDLVVYRARSPRTTGWQEAVYHENDTGTFTVSIRAFTSPEMEGNVIAIDDITWTSGVCETAPRDGSCDFDLDTCGYRSTNWVIRTGRTDGFEDHTTQTTVGGRAEFMTLSKSYGKISTPVLAITARRQCLSFFYYISHPTTTSSLDVTVTEDREDVSWWQNIANYFAPPATIWERRRSTLSTGSWAPAQIQFTVKEKFQIDFGCLAAEDVTGNFSCALDDVKLTDCTSEIEVDLGCDFNDNTTCFWTELGDSTAWSIRWAGRKDAVTGKDDGYYIEADLTDQGSMKPWAALASPSIPEHRAGVACFSFDYLIAMQGGALSKMDVGPVGGMPFWTSQVSKNYWHTEKAEFKLSSLGPERQIVVNITGFPSTYLDNLAVTMGGCDSKEEASGSYDCDFERDMCTFKSDEKMRRWMLGGRHSKSGLPRPPTDHTYQSGRGSYLYATMADPNDRSAAHLDSPVIDLQSRQEQCMEFFYRIPGPWVAKLMVFVAPPNTDGLPVPEWTADISNEAGWTPGRIRVPKGNRVSFMALPVPDGNPGYVALDDITFYSADKCDTVPGMINNASVSDLLDCDFNMGSFCNWQSKGSRWQFGSALAGPLPAPRPKLGEYIFFKGDTTGNQEPTAAKLVSVKVPRQDGPACVEFFYHMFSGDRSVLHVTVSAEDSSSTRKPFWRSGGTTADRWYRARRTLILDNANNVISFEVEAEKDFIGLVALTGLKFIPGPCMSDEDSLGLCDFDHDTCGWETPEVMDTKWDRAKLPQDAVQFRQFPEALQSGGNTLVARATRGVHDVSLVSPPWETLPSCLEFWYRRSDETSSSISAAVTGEKRNDIVWRTPDYPRNNWMLARVPLVGLQNGSPGSNLRLVLKTNWTVKSTGTSELGIGNVRTTPMPCDSLLDCSFTYNLCGYVEQGPPEFRWRVGSGRAAYEDFQIPTPPEDERYFAYIDASTAISDAQQETSLFSPVFATGGNDTISVTYMRKGKHITSLELVHWTFDSTKQPTAQKVQLPPSDGWSDFHIYLYTGEQSQIEVRTKRSDGRRGIVGLLGIQFYKTGSPTTGLPRGSSLDCTFEDGSFCGWTANNTVLQWAIKDPSKEVPSLPRFDATTSSYSGRFAYAELPDQSPEASASLISPELPSNLNDTGFCVSLWVAASGTSRLEIDTGRGYTAWPLRGPFSWMEARRFADQGRAYRVTIQVDVSSGAIAVDDIKITPGECPPTATSTFEGGSGWTLAGHPLNARSWVVKSARTVGVKDHTLDSPAGHVLYLNTSSLGDTAHSIARVVFGKRRATDAACLTFWWKSYGASTQLNVYRLTEDMGLRDPLLSITTEETPKWWNGRSVTVSSHTDWNVVFEGVIPNFVGQASAVLLDDLAIKDGACDPDNLCTFETANCFHWAHGTHSNTNLLNPVMHPGVWKVQGAGAEPAVDHTDGNTEGHFLYFAGGNGTGAAYVLTGRRFRCVSFWYYLPEQESGACSLVAGKSIRRLPTRQRWKFHQYDVYDHDSGILVLCGRNPEAFAAVDDLSVSEDMCIQIELPDTQVFECRESNQTVPLEKRCDFSFDCVHGEDEKNCGACDFEEDACGWSLGLSKVPMWQRVQGLPDKPDFPFDHTKGSPEGFFAMAIPTGDRFPDTRMALSRRMESPRFRNPGSLCIMNFWYIYKTNNYSMNLQMDLRTGPYKMMLWNLLSRERRPEEEVWTLGSVFIGRYTSVVQVIISAMQYPVRSGYIAIDDISFHQCRRPEPKPECGPSEFRCRNRACIRNLYVCDYNDDCGDLSDEEDCGKYKFRCSFDASLCDWHLDPDAPLHGSWERRAPFAHLSQGPTRDHSTRNTEGKFLYLGSSSTPTQGEVFGPWFDPKTPCQMRLHFVVRGPALAQVSVNTLDADGVVRLAWGTSSPLAVDDFVEVLVPFNMARPYQVVLEGSINGSRTQTGYVAIDDVTFATTCTPLSGPAPQVKKSVLATRLCPQGQYPCKTSHQCLDQSLVCDFKRDCKDGSDEAQCGACDFSVDMCGWKNSMNPSRVSWERVNAQMALNNPTVYSNFPKEDSFNNSRGWYCSYTDTNTTTQNMQPSLLISPELGATGPACAVTFYAYIGAIASVSFGINLPGLNKWLVSSAAGPDHSWRKLGALVGPQSAGFKFTFMASNANVSIDDIEYHDCEPGSKAQKPLNCTFEEEEGCGWYQVKEVVTADWIISDGRKTHENQPNGDHTTGTGRYIYATQSSVRSSSAKLFSEAVPPTSTAGRCLSFWYQMKDNENGMLYVILNPFGLPGRTIYQKAGLVAPEWKAGRVNIVSDKQFKIAFGALLQGRSNATIALDDIVLDEEPCPDTSVNCDFEEGTCGWNLDGWALTTGLQQGTPPRDHSTFTASGHFAVLRNLHGSIVSPMHTVSPQETRCLKFWHFVSPGSTEVLAVSPETNASAPALWHVKGIDTPAKKWSSGTVNIAGRAEPFSLMLKGYKSNDKAAVVAVDDISFAVTACPPPGTCTFEENLCNWHNAAGTLNLTWIRTSTAKRPAKSRPPKDHTTGKRAGRYMYLDFSRAKRSKAALVGTLESEVLHYSPTSCLQFFYYINRVKSKGTATLSVEYVAEGKVIQYLTDTVTLKKRAWVQYSRTVTNLPEDYVIRITGTPGKRAKGVAVDDITVLDGRCPGDTAVEEPTEAPGNCTKWDCDFETSMCFWKGSSWVIRSGQTAIELKEGPTMDRRMQTSQGQYAFFSPKLGSQDTTLVSAPLDPSEGSYCVEFWYFLFSSELVNLDVSVAPVLGTPTKMLWFQQNSAQRVWRRGSVTVPKNDSWNGEVIRFRALPAVPGVAEVAIDDVRVHNSDTCVHPPGTLCDFEGDGFCGFTVQAPDEVPWRRRVSQQRQAVSERPQVDHTFGTAVGHYLLLETENNWKSVRSYLVVPGATSSQGSCVRLWYHFGGNSLGAIFIGAVPKGTAADSVTSTSFTVSEMPGWIPLQSTLSHEGPHDIVITGTLSPRRSADGSSAGARQALALDDILVTEGPCPAEGDCNFEDGLCDWQNVPNAKRKWILNRGQTHGLAPAFDHTVGSPQGSYIYIEGNSADAAAILESAPQHVKQSLCLDFWFWIQVNSSAATWTGKLRVEAKPVSKNQVNQDQPGSVLFETSARTTAWTRTQVNIPAMTDRLPWTRIRFVGDTSDKATSAIALDDVTVTAGSCAPTTALTSCGDGKSFVNASQVCDFKEDCPSGEDEKNCGECDFENGTCGWTSVRAYSSWIWTTVSHAPAVGFLPITDKNDGTQQGGYVYSAATRTGHSFAVLRSPDGTRKLKRSSKDCIMSFWYFTTGDTSPLLAVWKNVSGSVGAVWRVQEPGSHTWQRADAAVGSTHTPFTMELVARVNANTLASSSAVSVDSVSFRDCGLQRVDAEQCDQRLLHCAKTKVCIDKDRLCDHEDDCGDQQDENVCDDYHNFCTFQTAGSRCDWTAVKSKGGAPSWVAISARYSRRDTNTGPWVDHTTGVGRGGRVLLLRATNSRGLNAAADYVSPDYVAKDGKCRLRFFYYLHGSGVRGLTLFAQFDRESNSSHWRELWQASGAKGQVWLRTSVPVEWTEPFRFVLRGTTGANFSSDIAVDDISLTPGCARYAQELPGKPTETIGKCRPSQFECRSGGCIPKAEVCDFRVDCKDGSDEYGCGPCDFEQDTCGWTDQSKGKVVWQRTRAKNKQWIGFDHTMGTESGHVIVINDEKDPSQVQALWVSPELPPSSTRCKGKLWAFFKASKTSSEYMQLQYVPTTGEPVNLTTIHGGSRWTSVLFDVPQNTERGGRLHLFLSLATGTLQRQVAIDDVSFLDCAASKLLLDCSFDDEDFNGGFCHWRDNRKGGLSWLITNHDKSPTAGGVPTRDHTTGKGNYALYYSDQADKSIYATLQSAPMPRPDKGVCFSFWYYPYRGETALTVEVVKKGGNYWSRNAVAQGNKWLYGELFISSSDQYTVEVQAFAKVRGSSLALDDFLLSPGPCRHAGFCDFETDMCLWLPVAYGLTQGWQRQNGSVMAAGPRQDHTLSDMYGHYMVTTPGRRGDTARLMFMSEDAGERCIQFWYIISSDAAGNFSLYQNASDNNPLPIWSSAGHVFGVWRKGQASLQKIKRYFVVFEVKTNVSTSRGSKDYVALDDVKITVGLCASTLTCDFEEDMCNWYSDISRSNFEWLFWRAADSKKLGGPSVDVTTVTNEGSYVYAPFSNVQRGDQAVLLSDEVDVTTAPEWCLTFWHSFRNVGKSSLRLVATYNRDNDATQTIVTHAAKASSWIQEKRSLRVGRGVRTAWFQLIAKVAEDYDKTNFTGIAIDEINFKPGLCGTPYVPPAPSPDPPHPLDCDFETDDCAWINGNSDATWKRVAAYTFGGRSLRMPKVDHTTASFNGNYAVVVRSSSGTEESVLITERAVKIEDKGLCVKFWYYMYGSLIRPLRFASIEEKQETAYWWNAKSEGPQWNYAQAFVPGPAVRYLAFLARKSTVSQTALDDISASEGPCPPPRTCGFESDECGWGSALGNRYHWRREKATTVGLGEDHTTGGGDGHVFAVDFSKKYQGLNSATVVSAQYKSEEALCLRLWYQISGNNSLTVGSLTNNKRTTFLTRLSGGDGEQWRSAQVRVPSWYASKSHRFFFQTQARSLDGIVAVDDIQVLDDCPDLGSCDFEKDFCMWENQDVSSQFSTWERRTGGNDLYEPQRDHTFGTVYGSYAIIYPKRHPAYRTPSKLVSPYMADCADACFSFWMYRNGSQVHDMTVFVRTNDQDIAQEYKMSDDAEDTWAKGQIHLPSGVGACQIGFAPSFPVLRNKFFALDDLEFKRGPCSPLEDVHHPSFTCDDGDTHLTSDKICNFASDCKDGLDEAHCGTFCDFEGNHTCNWSRKDAGTRWVLEEASSGMHEPKFDRTTMSGSGHYVSLKRVSAASITISGSFASPYLVNAAPTCRFIFWCYSNLPRDSKPVKVRMRSTSNRFDRETTALVMQGSQRPQWQKVEVVIGRVSRRFAVLLEGDPERGNASFAIDDISFHQCAVVINGSQECNGKDMYQCANGNCVHRNQLCDFTDDCGDRSDEGVMAKCNTTFPGRCSFELGVCDWTFRDSRWRLQKGAKIWHIHRADDFRDHTVNSIYGNAVKLPFRYSPRGSKAIFQSPILSASSPTCSFRFYYMYSTQFRDIQYDRYNRAAGSLAVRVRTDVLGAAKLLWKTSRVHGQFYERALVGLGDTRGQFQIVIEGVTGSDVNGQWIVDDVSFTDGCAKSENGTLPTLIKPTTVAPPASKCEGDHFACGNGQCIGKTSVCDFHNDCDDGSDETRCATCSFDRGTCGWVDYSAGNVYWKRVAPGDAGKPPTSGANKGYFMSIEKLSGSAVSNNAVMEAGPLQASSKTCRFEFFYFASVVSRNSVIFSVVLVENSTSVPITSFTGDSGGVWTKASVELGIRTAPWFIRFVAKDHWDSSRVAVDDVTMLECSTTDLTPGAKCEANGMLSCPGQMDRCIYDSQVCNFAKDCTDGSDEASCDRYPERCDFEKDTCGWKLHSAVGTASWEISAAKSYPWVPGDHTRGDATGRFFSLEKKDANQKGSAVVSSVAFKPTTDQKCKIRFWFFMADAESDALKVFLKQNSVRMSFVLENVKGDNRMRWQQADVILSSQEVFRVLLVGTKDAGSEGLLAIDDVSFTPACTPVSKDTQPWPPIPVQPPGRCNNETEFMCEDNSCIPSDMVCDFKEDCVGGRDEKTCPSTCDFEGGDECGWRGTQNPPPGFSWGAETAIEAVNVNPNAPPNDTTTKSREGDYFMAWVAEGTGATQHAVRIFSPTYRQAGPNCKATFNYWLHNPANVAVQMWVAEKDKEHVVIFDSNTVTDSSNTWNNVTLGIGRRKEATVLQLEISAPTTGGGAFFALDDLRFIDCAYPKQVPKESVCPASQFRCKNDRYCVPNNNVCDLSEDCSDGSDEENCQNLRVTFEDGTSGPFQHVGKWQTERGPSSLRRDYSTGPLFDHTTRDATGTYIKFGDEFPNYGTSGSLLSPVFLAGKCRVTFHVYMYGDDINSLSLRKLHKDRSERVAWEQKGPLGDFWSRQTVLLDEKEDFQLSFVAQEGSNPGDLVALDDISFGDECRTTVNLTTREPAEASSQTPVSVSTPGIPTTPKVCGKALFSCGDRCIPSLFFCDGVEDCLNGADEQCEDSQRCPQGSVYCSDSTSDPCLPPSKICDGVQDCSDGSDESLCGVCPKSFCLNFGICQVPKPQGFPSCSCKGELTGYRCSRNDFLVEHLTIRTSSSSSWVTALSISLVLIVALAAGAWFLVRRRRILSGTTDPTGLVNPSYDVPMEEIGELALPEASTEDENGITNPTYES